eukprot:TRINITY_DN2935_c0_g1_i20.p1 TRINITY_DN2935_c0_g1~~TRINITY_DN2935_c0_g1_i20.p1  ORF type:complete len:144 (+),score=8.54 TRINITY_DN2935_c0_g1_i20:239-670(+)
MDVKCQGCYNITTVFSHAGMNSYRIRALMRTYLSSHAQTVVICASCSTVLCQPTGGICRLLIERDLLFPRAEDEKRKHKKKRLVQSPNSYFMDVKCQGCYNITTVFSHAQTVVICASCSTVLCQPTGGICRLTEGCSFRPKAD